jgi:hypothetical protein
MSGTSEILVSANHRSISRACLRSKVLLIFNDRPPALSVRVVPHAEDVAVVGEDDGMSAPGRHGHRLCPLRVADWEGDAHGLDHKLEGVAFAAQVVTWNDKRYNGIIM